MARLASLESEMGLLEEKTKFLRGAEQSEVYVTPTAIKRRFAQIPKLLQESEPQAPNEPECQAVRELKLIKQKSET